ncbi:MAG: tetratricopeptide repeat protein [Burkholderiales bacterium]|nr:tetratricopeptide repeat protein [Burkholderiales bacterium]
MPEATAKDKLQRTVREANRWNRLGLEHHERAMQLVGPSAAAAAEQALHAYTKAASLAPHSPDPLCNAGAVLHQAGRFDEAEAFFRRALQLDPGHVQAHINLGQLLLLLGRLEEGWRHYAARHARLDLRTIAQPDLPAWQGEPLAGRSIVLWHEEGFGDCIQFVRYVAALKAQGAAHVACVCAKPMARLLATVPGLDEVLTQVSAKPAYDFWCYYLDTPMHLGTTLATIPAKLPYLHADAAAAAAWAKQLPAAALRVGICWKGSSKHRNDRRRSLAGLASLASLWQVPGVQFVSLQKGPGEEEAAQPPAGQPLVDAASKSGDFADTAAIVANLDLVITVDTSVAHLAGALGKPVWVLVPAPLPDWRWLLGRSDSPWYPGVMRLFRQRDDGDWAPVIAEVARALSSFATSDVPRAVHRAVAAHNAGDTAEAERLCRSVLVQDPQQGDALQLLGAICARTGSVEEAEALLRRALAVQVSPVVLGNLALLLRRTGREAEGVPLLETWTRLQPKSASAWAALARSLDRLERFDEAEAAYARALEIDPKQVQAKADLGLLLHRRGRLEQAAALLEQAAAARRGSVAAWDQLGRVYDDLAMEQAAVPRDSAALPPAADRSLEAFRKAADAAPDSPDPWNNLGVALQQFGRFDEAEAVLRKAMALAPDHWQARMNLGQFQLLHGRFDEGWTNFSARNAQAIEGMVPPPDLPRWDGEPLAGRSLVLWHEQGYGDCMQFVRYVPLLKAMGAARIGVACPPALSRLLATVPGIDEVLTQTDGAPRYDFWSYYLEVPKHLRTNLQTIPAKLPYLFADALAVREWAARLPHGGLRVGLVWRGSPRHGNDRQRSLPSLAALAPLWQVPGVQFISLQRDAAMEEAAHPPAGQPIVDIGSQVRDFADTAAVIASLDLLICVDTSVAHLAGAMGQRVWVLLPAIQQDWRWLLEREDSPWYPGVLRLFRQQRPGNWAPVIERVARELEALARAPGQDALAAAVAAGDGATLERLCRQVLQHRPGDVEALQLLGTMRAGQGRLDEAEPLLRRSLAGGETVGALKNLALLLRKTGRPHEALPLLERWDRLAPGSAEVRKAIDKTRAEAQAAALAEIQRGHARRDAGFTAEAESHYRQALIFAPDHLLGLTSLGAVLEMMGRTDEAEAALRRALAVDPTHAGAATTLGLVLLAQGRFEEGWRQLAARHRLPLPQHVPGWPAWPQWQGEPLAGRTILLWPEQGYGDAVQFVRYATELKQRGAARVTVACRAPLLRLLDSADGVDAVVQVGEPMPEHDFWCQMLDVPLHLGTTLATIPARLPYLHVGKTARDAWKKELPASGPCVGLVWKGAAGHADDANRSLPSLATLAPLWSVPGLTFVSLQKDREGGELAQFAATQPALDLGGKLRDFADTAALLERLDLLISVDTAAVHVAGALGRPCWVLLKGRAADWRWLTGRGDSPWYPGTLRLFRQRVPGDWTDAVADVAQALALWAAAQKPRKVRR